MMGSPREMDQSTGYMESRGSSELCGDVTSSNDSHSLSSAQLDQPYLEGRIFSPNIRQGLSWSKAHWFEQNMDWHRLQSQI